MKEIHILAENHFCSKLAKVIHQTGTNDFMSSFHNDFFHLLPKLPEQFIYAPDSGVALKMKHVDSHIDDFVGQAVPGYLYWGGMFGLTQGYAKIHVCNSNMNIGRGDFILFKDRKMHSVYANKLWKGLAVQVLKKR
jgi:hypothetical protein